MSLKSKTQNWVAENIITTEQAQRILELEKQHNSSIFIKISFALAASLIGLGISLLVAANWGKFGYITQQSTTFFLNCSSTYFHIINHI